MPLIRNRPWFARKRSENGVWIVPGRLLLAAFPTDDELQSYRDQGVRVVVNVHEQPHDPLRLTALGLTEVHLPVRDFTPPSPGQIDQGVAAIAQAIDRDQAALVHCLGGRGRGGTLAACYLVRQGMPVDAAIARVRDLRPGAIETLQQEDAIADWSHLPGRAGPQSTTSGLHDPEN